MPVALLPSPKFARS